jgi:hypothetical protein
MASLSWDRSHEVRSGRKDGIKIEREIKRNSNQDRNQKGGPEVRRFLKHH